MAEKYIALIPAYKPEAVLIDLLDELCASGFDCVVVDDGGGDAFAEIFKKASSYAKVLTHTVNRGKGAAMKTGFEYIKDNFGERIALIVEGYDKISNIQTNNVSFQSEQFRKLYLSLIDDIRVVLIKIINRLYYVRHREDIDAKSFKRYLN